MGPSMTVNGVIGMVLAASASALTPIEKWAAARRLSSPRGAAGTSDFWFFVLAVAALVILLALLWQTGKRRRGPARDLVRELFAENAARRGLSGRERQILLAISMRSGLARSHDIFAVAEAFDRGAAKLLAECLQTRTVEENERLKTEVACLREKLGFQVRLAAVDPIHLRSKSSRDIPAGSVLELTRRRGRSATTMQARVIRSDDLELAVDLGAPVETHGSDTWRVRYSFGMSIWEFDATVASHSGSRLVLNHSDEVRFVNRRRFPRVAVNLPALVARFPLIQPAASEGAELDGAAFAPPAFVAGAVTELAGPGLRIEAPLDIRAGDRVLVVFQWSPAVAAEQEVTSRDEGECIIGSIAHVRHRRSTSQGMSVAVELTGLGETDIDTLVRITNQAAPRLAPDHGPRPPAVTPEVGAAAVSGMRQEV